jgi:glycosyltransferase involved in cell wall biosynthesis
VTRQWAINGRFLAQPGTGVQRYAREVVLALDALLHPHSSDGNDLSIELLAPRDAADPPPLRNIGFRRIGSYGGHLWEQIVLPRHARGGLLSLCNTGPVRHGRQIVCIHDANTRTCPESYSRSFRTAYRLLLPALGRTAVAVATVSRFSASELVRFGICQPHRILVASNGHEHARRWRPAHSLETRRATGPNTIAIIGSPAPHKNVGLVLNLAGRLDAAGLRLAVVGSADPRVYRATDTHVAGNVAWLGRLGEAELAAVLRDCLCLAFPSLTEGFGLPPLEAMALGCPVVVSDRASLPEVCGDAALYASPGEPEAWLRHFVDLYRNENRRAAMAARGLARAGAFRWTAAAEVYLEAMRRADGLGHEAAACRSERDQKEPPSRARP